MKKIISCSGIIILIFTLICGSTVIAFASETASKAKSVTVYGHKYEYWSTIGSNDSRFISYSTTTKIVDGTQVGYLGQKARLYSTDGSLVSYRDWFYNTEDITTTTTLVFPSSYDYPPTGKYFYSKGQVKFYNGDGYTTYTCNATPNFQVSKEKVSAKKNAHGEIYGSELFLEDVGIKADLIQAWGNNGNIGYVKKSDLNYGEDVKTPNEAVKYMAQNAFSRIIPVYESDGVTVIDTFTVTSGHDINLIENK